MIVNGLQGFNPLVIANPPANCFTLFFDSVSGMLLRLIQKHR
jgi:hypothetical protein